MARGVPVTCQDEAPRHKSLDTLRSYVWRADLFGEHAGAAFF
jgi:hypothetical protein